MKSRLSSLGMRAVRKLLSWGRRKLSWRGGQPRGLAATRLRSARRRFLRMEGLEERAMLALSGTRTIGAGDNYETIKAAIADIQSQGLDGPLLLELQQDYVSSAEPDQANPINFSNLPGISSLNTLTLQPASIVTTGLTIAVSSPISTLSLDAVNFVTIDGRPGGTGTTKLLTIENTDAAATAVQFVSQATNNTIKYVTIKGVTSSASEGVVHFQASTGSGNDNNTIDNCDIGNGATTPTNAIYSAGSATAGQENSGNTISNSNIFNFYASGAQAAGVRLDGGNTDWTITGNSLYQTDPLTNPRAAVAQTHRAIYVNNTSGNNFTVTNNSIGGSQANAGGTAWTTTGTTAAYRFVGIQLNVGTTTPSSVQGNTIKNMVWTTNSAATTLPGVWSGIHVQAGSMNIGTTTGNTIGSADGLGTASILVTTSGTGGTTFGIASGSSGTVAISNNSIESIRTHGTTTSVSASLVGIQVAAGTNTISGNTIGSTIGPDDSLYAGSLSTSSTPQQVIGILSSSVTSATITNNTVAYLTNAATTSSLAQISGIATSAGSNTITGNTVRNLTTTSLQTGTLDNQSLYGIKQTSISAGQIVSQNVVHSLANSSGFSPAVSVTGIYFQGPTSGTNLIARNLVYGLRITSTSTSSLLHGMQFVAAAFTAQNNMVQVGIDAGGLSTAGASGVRGIIDNGNTNTKYYHNSVFVGGSQTLTQNTHAFLSDVVNNARDFRGNIFANTRTNSGGAVGKHYAVQYGGTTPSPAGLLSDGNIFFVSGVGGVLGRYNNIDQVSIVPWKAATGHEALSLEANPQFVAPTADTPNLHVQNGSPANAAGILVASVVDDFDGQTRSGLTPVDIGADAFTPAVLPTLSATLDGSANLVITDTDGTGKDNNLTVKVVNSGLDLEITDAVEQFAPPAFVGASLSNGNRTLTIEDFASVVTGSLTINGEGGNDAVAINFTGGNPIPLRGISFAGGAGTNDTLTFNGGTAGSVNFTSTGAATGTVDFVDTLDGVINGSDPIIVGGVEGVVMSLQPTAMSVQLSDVPAGNVRRVYAAFTDTRIESPGSVPFTFTNPTGSLTFNTGAGDDTINVEGVGSGFSANLTINGEGGTDTINFQTSATSIGGGVLSATAESLNTTSAVTATGGVTFAADTMSIGAAVNAGSGTATLKQQTNSRPINVGTENGGSLSLEGGELNQIAAGKIVLGDTATSSGAVTVSSAVSVTPSVEFKWLSTVTSTLTVNQALTTSGTFSATNLDVANLNANIAATDITGDATTVNVDDNPSGQIQDAIDIAASGATVNVATGTYTGDVLTNTKAITLSPGSSPGQATIIGSLTLDANDTLLVEINGLVAGSGYDQIVLNSLVSNFDQYASSVIGFSSEYSAGSWSAAQALGAPNTFSYGDITTSWAPANRNGTSEHLTLAYTTPAYARGVVVRETWGNGFVTQVDVVDTNDVLHTVWTGTDPSQPGAPADFAVLFPPTSYLVKGVKVYVNTDHDPNTYEEIDSVQLLGFTGSVGTAVLGGASLSLTGNYVPSTGNEFEILTYSDIRAGTFSNDTATLNNKRLLVNYDDANKRVLLTVEPAKLSATLDGSGNLTITDVDSVGKNNQLAIGVSGSDLVISDDNESFQAAPLGGTLSNGDRTLSIPLTSVTGTLTINGAGGGDIVTVAALPQFLAGLTVNGGTGDDTINLNGDVTFVANKSLNVDLTDDGGSTGIDTINVGTDANLILSGMGEAKLKASRNIVTAAGSSVEVVDGDLDFFANPMATLAGNFSGALIDGSLQTSGLGNIFIKGGGGHDVNSISHYGVVTNVNSSIESTASGATAGKITIEGTGGTAIQYATGIDAYGTISSVSGAIRLTGVGGTLTQGANSSAGGIVTYFGGGIFSTGTGANAATITLEGTGGTGSAKDHGIWHWTTIQSVDGDISLIGAGGGANDSGVLFSASGRAETTGSASFLMSGGISISAYSVVLDDNSELRLTGPSNEIIGDGIQIALTATIAAGSNPVTLEPFTDGTDIDLGGNSPFAIRLDDAQLDRITAGTVQIGDADTGTITVSADLTQPGKNLTLITGTGVMGSGAIINGSATQTTVTINQAGISAFDGSIGGPAGGSALDRNLGFTKLGAGTLTLTNNNYYTGNTNVNAGTLLVNGSTDASFVIVNNGGTLGGTGTVHNHVAVRGGGTLTGGDLGTVGNLTVGSVSFDGGMPTSGLVSLYRAENNATDTADGNNGSLQNGASFGSGRVGQAFRFNNAGLAGSDRRVNLGHNPSLNVFGGDYSFALWINPDSVASKQDVLTNRKINDQAFNLMIRAGGKIGYAENGPGAVPSNFFESSNTLTAGQWNHVAVVRSGSTYKIYINGTLNGSLAGTPANAWSGEDVILGAENFVDQDPFSGLIDELGIYSRALSDSEIAQIAANPGHGTLAVDFNGNVADTITTGGQVKLANVAQGVFSLNSQTGTTTGGNLFTLINNTAGGAIVSRPLFGAAEGNVITVNGQSAHFSYAGGSGGNDFTLTVDGAATFSVGGAVTLRRFVDASAGIDNLQLVQGTTILDSRPVASVTGPYTVNGQAGDDTLTIDFSQGNPIPASGVVFNGGDPTSGNGDKLVLEKGNSSGMFDTITHTFTSNSDGSVSLDPDGPGGTDAFTINYTGLEPISDNLDPVNRTFDFTGGSETITVTTGTTLHNKIDSSLGESVEFNDPTGTLTINAGSGDDIVTVTSIHNTFGAGLTINGGTGDDTIHLNADITFAADKSLDVDLQNDDVTPGVDRVSVGTGANLVLSGMGAATVKVSRDISLASGSSIVSVNEDITLEANRGGAATAGNFKGIEINNASVSSSGGNVSLAGKGGNNSAGLQHGIFIHSGGSVSGGGSTKTTVLTGDGGLSTGFTNYGVYVLDDLSTVSSAGGSVSIHGTGGGFGNPAGENNHGVLVQLGGTVTSGGGNVSVTGTGSAFADAGSVGVYVSAGGLITAGGTASVEVTGTGGAGAAGNFGVFLLSSASRIAKITSNDGPVTVTGAPGAAGTAIVVGLNVTNDATISTGNNKPLLLVGNSMLFDSTSVISAGSGMVTLQPRTNGTLINLGGADVLTGSPLTLGLTNSELNRVKGGTIVVGADGSTTYPGALPGTITVSSAMQHAGSPNPNITVVTAKNIAVNADWTATNGNLQFLANQQATATTGNIAAIIVDAATIRSTGANVSLAGRGGNDGGGSQVGVLVRNSAVVSGSGAGTATSVVGIGGGNTTGSLNLGVLVESGATITSGGAGTVVVSGTGGPGNGVNNMGVLIEFSSVITSGGSGSVTVNGSSDPGAASLNPGIFLQALGQITSGGGGVTVTGTGNGSNFGIQVVGTGAISTATNGGNVKLIADSMDLSATVSAGTGTATLQPRTAGMAINLGGADVFSGNPLTLALGLTDAELNRVTAGTIVIGADGSATYPGALPGTITVTSAMQHTGSPNPNISVVTAKNIVANAGWAATNGNLLFRANQQSTATTGNFIGIDVNAATIQSASGTVTLSGKGGTDTGGSQYGVFVHGGAVVKGGSGAGTTTTVEGTGGAGGSGSNGSNIGVFVLDANSAITSGGGNVSVTGLGGGLGNSSGNHGLLLLSGGTVTATGTGAVTVTGTAGSGTGANVGVFVLGSGSQITSAGGAVEVTGQGGVSAGPSNVGVEVSSGGVISSGSGGDVSVVGTGGASASNANYGVSVLSSGSITSGGGNVSVTGTGGGAANSGGNAGILLDGAGQISAGGSGNVTVQGTGGSTGGGSDN